MGMRKRLIGELLCALTIGALTFVLYFPTLSFEFVNWDDDVYVYENVHLQTSLSESISWFFSHTYYHSYIPLTMISYAIDCTALGEGPFGHHLTNVVLHAMNAVWVFFLCLRLLDRTGRQPEATEPRGRGVVPAACLLAAMMYAWHPLRVESVAWISGRKDLLCVFFLIPSTLSYLTYRTTTHLRAGWLSISVALFLCACLSKAIAVTAPLVFLLLDVMMFGRRDLKNILSEKILYFLIGATVTLLTLSAAPERTSSDMFMVMNWLERLLLPFYNSMFYLYKTVLPFALSPLYPQESTLAMLIAFSCFIALTILSLRRGKNQSSLLAWLSYLILIAPASGISATVIQTTADRYSYLASIPLFVLIGGMLNAAVRMFGSAMLNRSAIIATTTIVALFLAFTTNRQERIWMNSLTLWSRVVELFPSMPLPYNNLGLALQEGGERLAAEGAYRRAIELKKNYVEAHLNLGTLMFENGNVDEAERIFQHTTTLDSSCAAAYNNLGITAQARGDAEAALRRFKQSIVVDPQFAQAHFNIASLYLKMGNAAAASDALKKAALLGHRIAAEQLRALNATSHQ